MPMERIGIQEVPEKVSTGSTEQAGQSYKGFFVPPDQVAAVWEYVLPHIRAAVVHSEGELEPEDVFPLLCMGEMQLWVVVNETKIQATVITQIIDYPRKNVLRVLCLGGRGLKNWYHLFYQIEDFARSNDCSAIEAWARKGFEKMLPDWKSSYQILTKELRKDT